MATQVQFRRGTTTQNNAFTGAIAEITYDTEVKTFRIHDGSTPGGGAILINNTSAQTLTNKTLSTNSVWNGQVVGLGYGGTGASLSAASGAVAYSTNSSIGFTGVGSSGQLLVSSGTGVPAWVSPSSITAGTSSTAVTATNIAGGSAGYLPYQADTGTTSFIAPGAAGTFLISTGASSAPSWAAGQITVGTTAISLGSASTSLTGLDVLTATGTSNWLIPVGTTAQRPATPATGMIRYNSSLSSFEGYAASAWASLGGVKSVDGFTYIIAETSAGASNGDLDFYAENAGGTAATQIGQWNRTNLKDYTGILVGTQTTQKLFDTVATTLNIGGAATTITLGNATAATLTIRPGTVVGSNTTQNLYNTVATTLNIGGAATTLALGASTGTATIANPTVTLTNATTLNLNGASPSIATTSATASLFNSTVTTLNIGGAATTISIGASTGTTTINNNAVITGNLTVNGTTTTINATTITVDDINIELGNVTTPTDVTANGGGITLKGATDKTILWDSTNTNWTSSENWNIASGKTFKIANVPVLTSTAVLNDASQTSITIGGSATAISLGASTGTLTIGNATITGTNATTLNLNGASPSIVTSSTGTASVFNTNALTGNLFGAATTVSIGAASGTASINNATVTLGNATTLNINGVSPTIASSSTGTLTLFNTNLLTVNAFNAATTAIEYGAATSLTIGGAAAAQTITIGGGSTAASTYNLGTGVTATATTKTVNIGTGGGAGSTTNINIGSSVGGSTTINSATVVGAAATQNLFNTVATTLNIGGAATTVSIGASTGTLTINNANTVITGNLTINGTTTTVNSTTVNLDNTILQLGGDTVPTVDDNQDRGVAFRWFSGTAKNGFFGYDDSTGFFTFIPDATITSGVVSGTLGVIDATRITGSAATLTTARAINGTNFDGSAAITTATWGTSRTITLGGTGKAVDGSAAVTWTIPEIIPTTTNIQLGSIGVGTAASGTSGEIRATGTITGYYSDERLKTNIAEITNAVDKVKQLRGVTFNANEIAESYGYNSSKQEVGVLAGDVEKVLPQVVSPAPFDIMLFEGKEISKSGQNYRTVDYERIVPLLIQAIKEQQVMIEELQKKVG